MTEPVFGYLCIRESFAIPPLNGNHKTNKTATPLKALVNPAQRWRIYLLSCVLFCAVHNTKANDGVFYARGNQLIPVAETDISVRKEILSLKKVGNRFIEVTVYYEFHNPGNAKTITVGFEAASPSGDVEAAPRQGGHPFMRDFTVNMNQAMLPYEVAFVADSLYADKGKVKTMNLDTFRGATDGNYVDFFYVYHFQAPFRKGLNIIQHTYSYALSSSVSYHYDFAYVLTAANRWANKQIDDFTLLIDPGEFETFNIEKTFFRDSSQWLIHGIGKSNERPGNSEWGIPNALRFHVQQGILIFRQLNFKPAGELQVFAENYGYFYDSTYLPFSYYQQDRIAEPKDEFGRKVLKNLPFARRGYVFKDRQLDAFFRGMDWYIPNPGYQPDMEWLSEMEKQWIAKWK